MIGKVVANLSSHKKECAMWYFVKGIAVSGDDEISHDVELKIGASTVGVAVKEACTKIGELFIAAHQMRPKHVSILWIFDIIGNSYEWVEKPATVNVAIRGTKGRSCSGYWRVAL